jgi:hypothetical protein
VHRGLVLLAILASPLGCGALDLGSNVIWSSDFERGNLGDWSTPADAGGVFLLTSDAEVTEAAVAITTEVAHSGRYSAKLSSLANLPDRALPLGGGEGLFRQDLYPEEAYYSVWYYLPQSYQTTTAWAILKFKGVVASDAGIVPGYAELLDLSLVSLPGGAMTLVLSDARHQYGTSPAPDPVPIVPIGRWFQIESFYRNTTDPTGELAIWLDGTKIYDIIRPTGPNPMVYFSPCSVVYDLVPSNAVIYVDDVAISYQRLTPFGSFEVPN